MESTGFGHDVMGTSPGKPQLSAEAIAALHTALRDGRVPDDAMSSPALDDALCHICGEARLKNWPPESLLIAYKTALEMVPAVRRLARGPDHDEFVARLVSRCIDAYYRNSRR
ncbi:MAG TPA: hypothetical protein VGJ18_03470 [Gemmatimonadaceae bacterium]|jgi:hypothetical protein